MNVILAHQSHAKSFIINKLKAKCKEASTQLRQLELREADIDQKQQILREMKSKIQRNASIVDSLESDINSLMEAKGKCFDYSFGVILLLISSELLIF